jgi:mono/diheme cytochrome c family protein
MPRSGETAAFRSSAISRGAATSATSINDGVYTESQANRGAAAYEVACAGCHRADLSGNSGPALKEQRFARVYAGKDLRTLYSKIADTMPRNTPGSLTADVYLDIVAHVLMENGFKPGARELTADALDAIRVVPGLPKPAPPVGDFSYVEVIGCLTAGPGADVDAHPRERAGCSGSDRPGVVRSKGPAARHANVSIAGCARLRARRSQRADDVRPRVVDQGRQRAADGDQRLRDRRADLPRLMIPTRLGRTPQAG